MGNGRTSCWFAQRRAAHVRHSHASLADLGIRRVRWWWILLVPVLYVASILVEGLMFVLSIHIFGNAVRRRTPNVRW